MEVIGAISSSIAAIVVALISFFQVRGARRSAREKALQKEIDQKNAEQLRKEKEALQQTLDTLNNTIKTLSTKSENAETNINYLLNMTKVSVDYIKAISTVITALAEGLRDNNIDGNVSKAVESFHKFEASQLQALYRFVSERKNTD